MLADDNAVIGGSPEEPVPDFSKLPPVIETGLSDLCKAVQGADVCAPLPPKRKPLRGGVNSASEALELLNSHYLIGKSEQEVATFRIRNDGLLAHTPPEQFKLDVANIFVRTSGGSTKPAEKFWKENPNRNEKVIVFKPGGRTEPYEYNLWHDFAVEPSKGMAEAAAAPAAHLEYHLPRQKGQVQVSYFLARLGCAKSRQAGWHGDRTQEP